MHWIDKDISLSVQTLSQIFFQNKPMDVIVVHFVTDRKKKVTEEKLQTICQIFMK